jgi:hypothetical protein
MIKRVLSLPVIGRRKRDVLVVGTFRSGTNLAKYLLSEHFDVRVHFSTWAWKHGLPPSSKICPIPSDVPVLIATKDPFQLNRSLYAFWNLRRKELMRGQSLSEFVREPLLVYDSSYANSPRFLFNTPTDYWNQYHFAWATWDAIKDRRHILSDRQLLDETDDVLTRFGEEFGLSRRTTGTITVPEDPVAPSDDARGASTGDIGLAKPPSLSDDDITFITSLVRREVAELLGYPIRS